MGSTCAIATGGRRAASARLGLLAFTAVASAVLSASAQRASFAVKVDLVRVDVSVMRRNAPVGGLTEADFAIYDNGARQALQPVLVEEQPLEAWLVLDTSASVAPRLSQLVQAATSFIDGLKPRDRCALITFSDSVDVRRAPTSDLAGVRRAVGALDTSGITALYDATYVALHLREPGPVRGVAVVLTDGYDNISWLSADQVVESAKRSDSAIYGIAVADLSSLDAAKWAGQRREPRDTPQYWYLRQLAELSGGRVFDATWSELRQTFADILHEIRARYVLSYYPTSTAPGWHALEVKLTRARGDVRARRGYWVQSRGSR